MGPGLAWRGKHFIVKFARIVVGEEFDHEFSVSPPPRRANKKECVAAIIRPAALEVVARMPFCRCVKELAAKTVRFGSPGFLRLALVSRWQQSRRRRRLLPDRCRQCNPLPRLR